MKKELNVLFIPGKERENEGEIGDETNLSSVILRGYETIVVVSQ